MTLAFTLHPYSENAEKALDAITINVASERAAIGRAGTIAKRNNGPVDIARAGYGDWSERYLTTVSPSGHHAQGYRAERLA